MRFADTWTMARDDCRACDPRFGYTAKTSDIYGIKGTTDIKGIKEMAR